MNLLRHAPVFAALALLAATAGCKREERGFRVEPPQAGRIQTIRMSDLFAGPAPAAEPPAPNEYEENAFAMNEGKRLYQSYNCSGCHSQGGGGMGPALMDNRWIYGSEPAQIFSTIAQGRPNGMPSFRGKIPDHELWRLVAYVRSMSGNAADPYAAPTRSDDLSAKPAEQQTPPQPPLDSTPPPPGRR